MLTDFATFLESEWQLVAGNLGSFLIFGLFVFLMGVSISWTVHHYILEVKLHNLPERHELQRQIVELKNQVARLEKELRQKSVNELIREMKTDEGKESIGAIYNRNK